MDDQIRALDAVFKALTAKFKAHAAEYEEKRLLALDKLSQSKKALEMYRGEVELLIKDHLEQESEYSKLDIGRYKSKDEAEAAMLEKASSLAQSKKKLELLSRELDQLKKVHLEQERIYFEAEIGKIEREALVAENMRWCMGNWPHVE